MKGKNLVSNYQIIWDEFINTDLNKGTPSYEDNLLDRGFAFEFDKGLNPSYALENLLQIN